MKSALAENTVINDKYFINSVIPSKQTNQINYRCIDKTTNEILVLKEFFPLYATRNEDGKLEYSKPHNDDMKKFVYANKQAMTYGKLPTIIDVIEIIDANNTCYAVCKCFYGHTVEELVARGYGFTKTTVQNILLMLLKTNLALEKFNLCNRNFRPDNILITTDGYIKLCEFCPENNKIYETESAKSLAALGFYMATGTDTNESSKVKNYRSNPSMMNLLKYMLQVVNAKEVKTIDFYNAALVKFDTELLIVPEQEDDAPVVKNSFLSRFIKKKKRLIIILVAILAVALAVLGGYKVVNSFRKSMQIGFKSFSYTFDDSKPTKLKEDDFKKDKSYSASDKKYIFNMGGIGTDAKEIKLSLEIPDKDIHIEWFSNGKELKNFKDSKKISVPVDEAKKAGNITFVLKKHKLSGNVSYKVNYTVKSQLKLEDVEIVCTVGSEAKALNFREFKPDKTSYEDVFLHEGTKEFVIKPKASHAKVKVFKNDEEKDYADSKIKISAGDSVKITVKLISKDSDKFEDNEYTFGLKTNKPKPQTPPENNAVTEPQKEAENGNNQQKKDQSSNDNKETIVSGVEPQI